MPRSSSLRFAIYRQLVNSSPLNRAVAQLGSALEWGSRGPGFESRRPEKIFSPMFYVYVLRSEKTGRHREKFSTRAEAERKERYYKTGRGRDELGRLPP